ncbi:MAG: S1 RNA-binding domain-containing protein, partial [Planctomycetia bacterium]
EKQVGRPTREYSPEHIGVSVTRPDLVIPDYLFYVFEFLANQGAFVELAPGVEGLIHLSELAPTKVRRANDVVKVGQEISVKLLSLDQAAQRISLSIKALAQNESPAPEPEEQVPSKPAKPPKPRTTPLRGGTGAEGVKPLF